MTAPAAKGMSVSASVALRNQPEKRVRKAARPRGRAGRITGDKPDPWKCPPHSNINEKIIYLYEQGDVPDIWYIG
jgi:hypothetical protein